MHTRGSPITTSVIVGIGQGLQRKYKCARTGVSCEDGDVLLSRDWARSVLRRMGYSKRRGNSTSKILHENFIQLKQQYLIDIMSVVKFEEIPEQLILNWNETAIKIVPSASWTMAKRGSKRVEIAAKDDKCLCIVWDIFTRSTYL